MMNILETYGPFLAGCFAILVLVLLIVPMNSDDTGGGDK